MFPETDLRDFLEIDFLFYKYLGWSRADVMACSLEERYEMIDIMLERLEEERELEAEMNQRMNRLEKQRNG